MVDRAEISEVKYGAGTADPSTVIYESNIENYFEITNSSYGFYPAIPIPLFIVDAKGRITKAQTVYMPSVIDVKTFKWFIQRRYSYGGCWFRFPRRRRIKYC